ncbi:MAG: hypothetical protein J5744_07970 [Oscillospiraceae bacterium]|nr:hypothetical protein [Oscillospiraceae bacterium]
MRNRLYYLLSRMFVGRCGFDDLSIFLMSSVPLPFLLSMLLKKAAGGYISLFLFSVAMVLFVWSVWRAFSTKLYDRKRENDHFISSSLRRSLSGTVTRLSQIRDYRFYRCPGCRQRLRVPRGKGRIKISCPHCGSSFIRKT